MEIEEQVRKDEEDEFDTLLLEAMMKAAYERREWRLTYRDVYWLLKKLECTIPPRAGGFGNLEDLLIYGMPVKIVYE